ncbi:MAG: hypothetical protein ONB46_08580 [candidate division KSB1 bacterium]|nr:hypothetical protein [candidate division KSB1 bacterium]MDZ7365922.1 hypothetical protein [candidate division KSB1 bacterium]MDZ7403844.1 hypothetical protein [candidate division KSB1 bacterium]
MSKVRAIAIINEQFYAERQRLQREIEKRAKADEIDRRASRYIPFIGSILFTSAIILLKLFMF